MALLEKHLFVKESTIPGAGKGLFTKVEIPKGTRVVEYKGRRTVWKEVKNDSTNYYIYTINRNNVIDAQKTMSALARYANDAKGLTRIKGLTNNCVYVNEGNRAFIETVKTIPAGAELLVDYTKEYWDVMKENLRAEGKWPVKKAQAKKTAAKTDTASKKSAVVKKKATTKRAA
jgi:SET domain-containing protein